MKGIIAKVEFGKDAGGYLRKEEFDGHLKTVWEAMVDAEANEEQRRVDIGSAVEISRDEISASVIN